MKRNLIALFFLLGLTANLTAQITVSGATGANGNYTRLALAFSAINLSAQTGNNISVTISANITETASAILNAGTWLSIHIYPTVSGITISGNLAAPLIDLNGADLVTIDGSVNQSGSSTDMIITNTSTAPSTGTSTISFRNGATNNTIRYCNLRGSSLSSLSGIIYFYSTTTGNSLNLIENNNITRAAPSSRPINAIYSQGPAGNPNSNNIVSSNNIYDCFNLSSNSYSIFLNTNNTAWTISGNNFYETGTLSPTNNSVYSFIRIASGDNFNITGNFLGGSAIACGGAPLTKLNSGNNAFTAIYLNAGTSIQSSIQNNTISNIGWSNSGSASWIGIDIPGGNVNLGTIAGNIIGASSGTGSLTITGSTTGNNTFGIKISSTGTVNCQNNIISSIRTGNASTNAGNFFGIDNSASGVVTIINNTIGSPTTSNSIYASSGSSANSQYVLGIDNTGTGNVTIINNIIANLLNGSSNSNTADLGQITGITSTRGRNVITGNVIHDLSIANGNSLLRQTASVIGIALSGTTTQKTISGNTIYNLSNTFAGFIGGVIGIHFDGGTADNEVSTNFIHSLSVAGSSVGAALFGIRIASGTTNYFNNIISLGGSTASTIYGIYEAGATGNNNTFYFNTIFINGSSATAYSSYALFNTTNTNVRNYRNNIFVNARSNSGSTGRHYAIRLLGTTNLTIDYNDYFVSGSGGTLGTLVIDRRNLAEWQSATGQDTHSRSDNPLFTNQGGTSATDYRTGAVLPGIAIPGITTDFGSTVRNDPPSMGAWENPSNRWRGSATSSLWSLATNWTSGVLPGVDANIIFDTAPLSNCVMDGDRSVTNITNSSSYQLVTNGYRLTVKGILNLTNGARIDAALAGSTIEFAGTVAQTITSSVFNNDQVNNLIINNPNNVTLNGSLNLLNSLTVTSGRLDASSAAPTLIYGGTAAQTITSGTFLNDQLYNLTVDNSVGVNVNTGLSIVNNLTINPGRIFSIDPAGRVTVNSVLNNGQLNLNSTSASDIFSLIMESYSGSGTASAQLYLTGGGSPNYNWHYVAVPQDNLSKSIFTNINAFNLLSYNDSRVTTSDFNGWEWHDGFASPGIAGGAGFTTLSLYHGYNFYNGSNANVQLTGLNSLATTLGIRPLQYSGGTPGSTIFGYNLLGNSLTCSINWDNVVFGGSVNQAVYYTAGNKWATYLEGGGSTNGGTNYIPPLQGFFVKANAIGASVDFSIAREHSSQTRYKKSADSEDAVKGAFIYPKVKLELTGPSTSDETIIWYNNEATIGYDEKYDAYKLFSSEAAFGQLYSILGGQNYVINGIPLPADSSLVPLGVKIAQSGNYTLLKKELISPEGYDVLLIDQYNNNFTVDLKNNDEYSFSSEAGTFTDRFILKVSSISTTVEDPVFADNEFNIYAFNGIINIMPMTSALSSAKGEIRLFDLTGRIVKQEYNIIWQEGNLIQLPCNNQHGVYMVEVIAGTFRYVRKVILP